MKQRSRVALISGEANYIPGAHANSGHGILYKGRYVSSFTRITDGQTIPADLRDGSDMAAVVLKRMVVKQPVLVNFEDYASVPAIIGGLYTHKGSVVVTD